MAYNVLIVDDSRVVRSVVHRTLQLAGVELGEVHQAENGRQALEVLDRVWIDMVFADINMPVMSGLQMVDEMVSRRLMDSIPVVIISTERSITRIEELKSKGISAYLNKPFTPENIRNVVDQILHNRALAAGAGAGPT
jgi:two-component system chemotaxis response regulator CheY